MGRSAGRAAPRRRAPPRAPPRSSAPQIADAEVHGHVAGATPRPRRQQPHAAPRASRRRRRATPRAAAPRPRRRAVREVDRHAVGDGHGQQEPALARSTWPSTPSATCQPGSTAPCHATRAPCTWCASSTAGSRGASSARKARQRSCDAARGLVRPQAEGERPSAPRSVMPGHEAVPLAPLRPARPARDRRRARRVARASHHRSPRSITAPSAVEPLVDPLVAALDLADVVDGAGALGARARRGASPSRRGCPGSRPCRRAARDGPATTARCGSHSTMRAPIPMSLSTKNSRDSNIFSNSRIMPSHCVAVTSAMLISVGRERRPRTVLELRDVAAQVGRGRAAPAPRRPMRRSPSSARLDAEPLEAEQRGPQVVGAARPRS